MSTALVLFCWSVGFDNGVARSKIMKDNSFGRWATTGPTVKVFMNQFIGNNKEWLNCGTKAEIDPFFTLHATKGRYDE